MQEATASILPVVDQHVLRRTARSKAESVRTAMKYSLKQARIAREQLLSMEPNPSLNGTAAFGLADESGDMTAHSQSNEGAEPNASNSNPQAHPSPSPSKPIPTDAISMVLLDGSYAQRISEARDDARTLRIALKIARDRLARTEDREAEMRRDLEAMKSHNANLVSLLHRNSQQNAS